MDVKVNFFFSLKKQGWSETYYVPASDLDAAYTAARLLAEKRALVMAAPTNLDYIRVSNTQGNRESTLTNVGPDGGNLIVPNGAYISQAGEAQDAFRMIFYASGVSKQRPVYLHGYPDNALDRALPDNADANVFKQRLNEYGQYVVDNAWAIRASTVLDEGSASKVLGMEPGPNPVQTKVTLDADPGLSVGDYVQFYKITGLRPRPGIQRVLSVGPAPEVIGIGYTLPSGFVYEPGGFMQLLGETLDDITSYSFGGFTSHKVGRPFGVSRGRRPSIHP